MKTLGAFILINLLAFCTYGQNPPCITAVYEDQQKLVKLKWSHLDVTIQGYTLQKSTDNRSWFDLYTFKISNPTQNKFISYSDNNPTIGINYYRLKSLLKQGTYKYSESNIVIIGQKGNSWLLYPVPVRDMLNLQYNGNLLIPGVISIFIQNLSGRSFHKLRFASSSRLIQIPVSNLGSGIYDIRIVIDNKVVWNQRFVK